MRLLIFILLFSVNSFAEEETVDSVENVEEKLKYILENDPVAKKVFEHCQQEQANKDNPDIQGCMFKPACGADGTPAGCCSESADGSTCISRKSLTAMVEQHFPGSMGKGATPEKNSLVIQSDDPALATLNAYLEKKLQEALYGTSNKKEFKKTVANHKVFLNMFKTQLGKNVIAALSSFCMEARTSDLLIFKAEPAAPDPNNPPQPVNCETLTGTPSDRKQTIDQNKCFLKKFNADNQNEAFKHWNGCATKIQDVCHCNKDSTNCNEAPLSDYKEPNNDDRKYTKQRACEVVTYIKALRNNLAAVETLDKSFQKFENSNSRSLGNKEVYNGGNGQESIDSVTTLTSKEFLEKGEVAKNTEKEKQDFEQACGPNGEKQATPECQEFIISKGEADGLQKNAAEMRLRSQIKAEKIGTLDEKGVKDFLKDEGYTDAQIKQIFEKHAEDFKKVAEEIQKKYETEQQNLIASINDQINAKTVTEKEIKAKDTSTILDVKKELENKKDHYRDLIHFNNVVSGYLTFTDTSSGRQGQNTGTLFKELKGSAMDEQYNKVLSDETKKAGVKEEKDAGSQLDLSVDTINQNFLKYDGIKATPTPTP